MGGPCGGRRANGVKVMATAMVGKRRNGGWRRRVPTAGDDGNGRWRVTTAGDDGNGRWRVTTATGDDA
jgi:hypothetical protein